MLIFAGLILLIFLIMQPLQIRYGMTLPGKIAMLFPQGIIALKERDLLFILQIIMLFVIIPVYLLTFIFCWKYRAHNTKAKYTPNWDDNRLLEGIWWGIPLVFTAIIVVLTWIRTHELDPFKPLKSEKETLNIQVVALQWKWLFIYPNEKIATVNYFQIPKETPIHFEITADAPMNSFWIPQLGGQIYAMPKMRTELNLIANAAGDFRGSSANLSGEGFAGMHFIARASSSEEYQKWVEEAKKATETLDFKSYTQLAAPSKNNPVATFQLKEVDLFEQVLMKYMHPPKNE